MPMERSGRPANKSKTIDTFDHKSYVRPADNRTIKDPDFQSGGNLRTTLAMLANKYAH